MLFHVIVVVTSVNIRNGFGQKSETVLIWLIEVTHISPDQFSWRLIMIDFFVGFQLCSVGGTDRDQTGAVLRRCCIRQIIVGIYDLLIGFFAG